VTKPLGEHRIHDKKANCLGLQGLDRAIQNGVSEVAVFLAASEAFNKANLGCSIPDSLSRSPPPPPDQDPNSPHPSSNLLNCQDSFAPCPTP